MQLTPVILGAALAMTLGVHAWIGGAAGVWVANDNWLTVIGSWHHPERTNYLRVLG
ncbi:hypothetical protein B0H67DRAFT_640231 [Lasiosphaeris hirsuta]|uniref:Uncharacterized protein n=1 Tax=Lasiosphaeris hirsuta TaxID=260670 RepID=A0AA40BCT0_9PEZI|nr:hypothetical protein B0H67DRAFT_640231 [Lasiosphaeris hirsuta]